jgi:hypothetical protein
MKKGPARKLLVDLDLYLEMYALRCDIAVNMPSWDHML